MEEKTLASNFNLDRLVKIGQVTAYLLMGLVTIVELILVFVFFPSTLSKSNTLTSPQNSITPTGSPEANDGITRTIPPVEASVWKIYKNEIFGFEFTNPGGYSLQELSDPFGVILRLKKEKTANLSADINIRYLSYKQTVDFKQILISDVVYDPSGLPPKSFNEFSKRTIGKNSYYFIKTGLFEGQLNLRYYLVRKNDILVFELVSRGVDWTNPKFDPEKELFHQDLKKFLSTFNILKE